MSDIISAGNPNILDSENLDNETIHPEQNIPDNNNTISNLSTPIGLDEIYKSDISKQSTKIAESAKSANSTKSNIFVKSNNLENFDEPSDFSDLTEPSANPSANPNLNNDLNKFLPDTKSIQINKPNKPEQFDKTKSADTFEISKRESELGLYNFCQSQFDKYKDSNNNISSENLYYLLNNFNTFINCSQDNLYIYNIILKDYLKEHIENIKNITFLDYYEIVKYLKKIYQSDSNCYKNLLETSIQNLILKEENENKLSRINIDYNLNRKTIEINEQNQIEELALLNQLELKKKKIEIDKEIQLININLELENKKRELVKQNEIRHQNHLIETEKNKKELEILKTKLNEDKEMELLSMELGLANRINQFKTANESEQKYMELEKKRRIKHIELVNIYDELDVEKKKKEIKNKIDICKTDEVDLYPYEIYNGTCCNLNFCPNQNVIVNFDKIYKLIIGIPSLSNYEKNLILLRFNEILTYCSKKYNSVSKFYRLTQIFIIASSIINPALLSININQNNPFYQQIFWTVWILQLMVSLVTGYISFFKWDKKNFLFNIYKTKINQEIWLFIGLTGKNYSTNNGEYDHSKYVNTFLNRLENLHTQLKISEFETEIKKDNENNNNTNNPNPISNPNPNPNSNPLDYNSGNRATMSPYNNNGEYNDPRNIMMSRTKV